MKEPSLSQLGERLYLSTCIKFAREMRLLRFKYDKLSSQIEKNTKGITSLTTEEITTLRNERHTITETYYANRRLLFNNIYLAQQLYKIRFEPTSKHHTFMYKP